MNEESDNLINCKQMSLMLMNLALVETITGVEKWMTPPICYVKGVDFIL